MSEREWHYVHERTREGPIPESDLRSRLENGDLPIDVTVWSDGLGDWIAANEEPTFQNVEVSPRRPTPAPSPVQTRKPRRSANKAKAATERIAVPPDATAPASPAGFYLTRDGTNSGPFRRDEIIQMVATRVISEADLVWREGLATWMPIGALFTFVQPPPALPVQPPRPKAVPARIAPAKPAVPISLVPVISSADTPGIGRLAYLGILIVITIAMAALGGVSGDGASGFPILLLSLGSCLAVAQRLKNIGRSPWLSLLIFIPVANLFVGIPCLFAPPNYAHTKQLDGPAKITAGVLIGLVVLMIVIGIIAAMN